MTNAWITADGSAATPRPESRNWRRPRTVSARGGPRVPPGEPVLTQWPTVHPRDSEGVAPSLVVHHEHTNVVSPSDISGSAHRSFSRADSTTMTAPETSATQGHPGAAPLLQTYFDRSAAVRLHSSQAGDERTLPPVSEVSHEEVPSPSLPPSNLSSTTATADSTSLPPSNLSPTMTTADSCSSLRHGHDPLGLRTWRTTGGKTRAFCRLSVFPTTPYLPCRPDQLPKTTGPTNFTSSSEEESPPPPPQWPGRSRSPDSDYSREHRADSRGPTSLPEEAPP